MHVVEGMNFPFKKKQQPSVYLNSKYVAAGIGTAAGVGLIAFGVKKFLDRRKQSLKRSELADLHSSSGESTRGAMNSGTQSAGGVNRVVVGAPMPRNRVDRDSMQSFPASDAPSHMPGSN